MGHTIHYIEIRNIVFVQELSLHLKCCFFLSNRKDYFQSIEDVAIGETS